MSNKSVTIVVLVGLTLCTFFGYWRGAKDYTHFTRLSAIKAGVGKFVLVDPTNNISEFVWVSPINTETNK